MSEETRSLAIKARARELGFDAVGIAAAGPADPRAHLQNWIHQGFHADMDYMVQSAEIRRDPREIIPGAKSVIALAISYYWPDSPAPDREGSELRGESAKIARYARGIDYHKVLKKKVRRLRRFILGIAPEARVHPSVDTSPVLEREWARRAGIAWIGKSSMAISRELGTYTFLATLITDLELSYDRPHPDHCGSCTACLDACPTQAFVAPYQLDARKCITYWTVEHRGAFTEETPDFFGWIAGCDICQEVCPWNKFKRASAEARFTPREALTTVDIDRFAEESERSFREEALAGTALQRTGADELLRNARHLRARTPK